MVRKTDKQQTKSEPAAGGVIQLPPMEPLRGEVYLPRHVNVQLSTHAQRVAFRRLFDALDQSGARLANDRRVASPADVVRWVAERVGEATAGVPS